jgi:hypothetical protein
VKNSYTKRWQEAQRAELDWWQNWRRLPFYTNHSFENNWRTVLSHFLTPSEMSDAKTIIEVGTGPHGVVRYLFEDASIKIGLDPLLCRFDERPRPDKNTCYVAAVGEFLPVRDAAADLVVCINVLDHVMDAGQILRETAGSSSRTAGFYWRYTPFRKYSRQLCFWIILTHITGHGPA